MPKCRYCEKEIKFVKTKVGKATPVEAKTIHVYVQDGDDWILKMGHEVHFGNCPPYDNMRKKKHSPLWDTREERENE